MPSPAQQPRYLRYGLWLGISGSVALVVGLSWRQSPAMSELSWIPYSVARWADQPANDETRTAVPFFVLAAFTMLLFRPRPDRPLPFIWMQRLLFLLTWMLLAGAVEIAQFWRPHRYGSWSDVLWGWAGILAGAIGGLGLRGLFRFCSEKSVSLQSP